MSGVPPPRGNFEITIFPHLFKQLIKKNTEKRLYFLFQVLHALSKIKTLYLNISIASCQFGGSKE